MLSYPTLYCDGYQCRRWNYPDVVRFHDAADIYKGRVSAEFLETPTGNGAQELNRERLSNPVLGGIVVSMANPYWWVWWATIGMAFMTQFNISLTHWPNLLAFFFGHEAGDLACYLIVSMLAFFGLKRLNRKVYIGVLTFCGLFMILFGLYLGFLLFQKSCSKKRDSKKHLRGKQGYFHQNVCRSKPHPRGWAPRDSIRFSFQKSISKPVQKLLSVKIRLDHIPFFRFPSKGVAHRAGVYLL
jgi:hypothetical protein